MADADHGESKAGDAEAGAAASAKKHKGNAPEGICQACHAPIGPMIREHQTASVGERCPYSRTCCALGGCDQLVCIL